MAGIGLAVAGLLAAAQPPGDGGTACLAENALVRLSGRIVMQPRPRPHRRASGVAVLRLDRPICYDDPSTGSVGRRSEVALLPAASGALAAPARFDGRRVQIDGMVTLRVTPDQPPYPILISEPQLVRVR